MKRHLALVLLVLAPLVARAQQRPLDAAQLQLALRKLNVVGSALYVAAHPDDENTALLAFWSNDRLYRTAYLSMTRGDGGQNLIGDEKGELLGVIRTQELLAARRIDGAEQMFTRALDFGFSKGPEETLQIWGHDRILADVVWAIRKFQPDVIVTRFPTNGAGGHGHHTASAMLAVEAFKMAGDATKFPEQLKYVTTWQPKRLFWNRFSFTPIDPNDPAVAKSLRLDLGAFNPLLGRAYTEIAAESRSQHKSQGFGSAERRGTTINYFDQLDGAPATKDLFEGIDVSWSRYPGGETVGKLLQQAADTFDPRAPEKTIPLLLDASAALDRLAAQPAWSSKVNPWIEVKRNDLQRVIAACAGLAIDVSAADATVVAGRELKVAVTVINRSGYPFLLQSVGSRYATPSMAVGKRLANNEPVKTEITIKLPADYPISQPYWLRKPPLKGSYVVDDQELIGRPENPPAIPLIVSISDDRMHTLFYTVPAVYRWTDPVKGEQVRNVDVVPEAVSNVAGKVYVFPESGKSKQVSATARSFTGGTDSALRLRVPQGWSVTPESVPVSLKEKGDEARATFTVTPPAADSFGAAEAQVGSGETLSVVDIDYPHIPAQRVFAPATAKLIREDVKTRGTRIGYIMGSGDEVPEALRQIGYTVNLLTDDDLERGNFAGYDAIVVGVRAYNTRRRLKLDHPKLMEWVQNGGTLVVQYNWNNGLLVDPPGPYPFKVTNDRVTVEEAPVTFVLPDHPLLNEPNKITAHDFENWVQERGVYFTQNWADQYQTPLESHDPGESPKRGGELYARYGKGVFIYTGYDWFRELPAGVPGAYPLFANMVSAR